MKNCIRFLKVDFMEVFVKTYSSRLLPPPLLLALAVIGFGAIAFT